MRCTTQKKNHVLVFVGSIETRIRLARLSCEIEFDQSTCTALCVCVSLFTPETKRNTERASYRHFSYGLVLVCLWWVAWVWMLVMIACRLKVFVLWRWLRIPKKQWTFIIKTSYVFLNGFVYYFYLFQDSIFHRKFLICIVLINGRLWSLSV